MSYRIRREEHPGKAISRILCEQIDKAVYRLHHFKDPNADAVHRVRVGCKKIRAVLRMVRPRIGDRYQSENAWFRDTARKLAALRDAGVMVTTLEHLQIHSGKPMIHEDFLWVRERLQEQFRTVLQDTDREHRVTEVIEALRQAGNRLLAFEMPVNDFDGLKPGLKKTLNRAAGSYEQALDNPSPPTMHEWRKRIKYHMYHTRVLRDVWSRPMKGYAKSLNQLSDLLGETHDLDIFRMHLAEQENTFGGDNRMEQLLRMIDYRRDCLRQDALTIGAKVHAEKPKRWCKRMQAYWAAWHSART